MWMVCIGRCASHPSPRLLPNCMPACGLRTLVWLQFSSCVFHLLLLGSVNVQLATEEDQEAFRTAWAVTADVCEWALCVVDKVLLVLETKSKLNNSRAFSPASFVKPLFSQVSHTGLLCGAWHACLTLVMSSACMQIAFLFRVV